jgi:site-specific DNA recombinase
MKSDYGEMVRRLELKLSGIDDENKDIEELLKAGVENLMRLNEYYENGNWIESRDLLGSIFPENFTISENGFRTGRINEVVHLIYSITRLIGLNKKGTKKKISSLSQLVAGSIQISNLLLNDFYKVVHRY